MRLRWLLFPPLGLVGAVREDPFQPDWTLPPEPEGEDECEVILLYLHARGPVGPPWKDLEEWQRESWRREYREEHAHA